MPMKAAPKKKSSVKKAVSKPSAKAGQKNKKKQVTGKTVAEKSAIVASARRKFVRVPRNEAVLGDLMPDFIELVGELHDAGARLTELSRVVTKAYHVK